MVSGGPSPSCSTTLPFPLATEASDVASTRLPLQQAERADQHRRVAGAQREFDQKHAAGIGQDLAPHHRPGAFAAQPCHGDEIAGGDLDGGRARHPGHPRGIDQRHHHDDQERASRQLRACRGDGEQRQHQERNADDRFEQALDDVVDPASDIAREQTDHRADDDAEPGARQGQQQHNVAAVNDPAEDVAAELIDAELVRTTCLVGTAEELIERIRELERGGLRELMWAAGTDEKWRFSQEFARRVMARY